ncbi:MAG TPA: hypothetical protein VGW37_11305 [Terriglobia bacterium]|nr:hypothetical protein [Terriglobia bacterium]
MPTIVAFLDVLGFSNYTEQDLAGAQLLLRHQEFILRQKLEDGQLYPAAGYPDPDLARMAEAHLVDSFSHFLPFSDSIFIVSEDPDKFARQLSHFLIECLNLVGHVYDDADDPGRPEAVTITELPSGEQHVERWYPPIWRGGLGTGALATFRVTGIDSGATVPIPNLAGAAVVKAVRAEKAAKCRGPRLLCEKDLIETFGPDIRPYFRCVTDSISELLWPAFQFEQGNNPRVDMLQFHELWNPVVGLWKSKRGQPAFEHYDEFLKLLVRSFLCWADLERLGTDARRQVRDHIRTNIADQLSACESLAWWRLQREQFHDPN